jgi:anaerobic selenocysteine-containing dehydrogenase
MAVATPTDETHRSSFCRICCNFCPVVVTVQQGRVTAVEGDRDNPVWQGFSCVKGRKQHERMYSQGRLLHSRRRTQDGDFESISSAAAIEEIAARLREIIHRYGPESVAYYTGSGMIMNATSNAVAVAVMESLGVRNVFTPNTIDKPGKTIARALHGSWMAPAQGYHDPGVALLIGVNPYVCMYEGAPGANPGWLRQKVKAGMKLIVIDPRRTETADRATIHLQPRPGHDSAILAAFLRVALEENLYDRDFVSENVAGVEALRQAVEPFTPELAGERAGVDADALVAASREYFGAARGYVFAGTGPSMSDPGPLTEYLVNCIVSLAGHVLREGEQVATAPVLLPTPPFKAQASPPRPARDPDWRMRVRDLAVTPAGPPVCALADEMLLEGEGQIRALISNGGNPVGAWPNEAKVIQALLCLDLLVQIDPVMSQTAQLADYVIAPRMSLENPDTSQWHDFLPLFGAGYGNCVAHGQYTEAVVEPPAGSDVIAEWEFFYGLAAHMGIEQLEVTETCLGFRGIRPFTLRTDRKPTTRDLLEKLAEGSRVPLDEVMLRPGGSTFPDPPVAVLPKDPDWPHKLDAGNPEMLAQLGALAVAQLEEVGPEVLRLICRRALAMNNTYVNDGVTTRGRTHNPAYLHPSDLERLGLQAGDQVEIRSDNGAINAIVDEDDRLRPGLLSITHGYGKIHPDGTPVSTDPRAHGSNIERLISDETHFDPYSGMARMSNVPVTLRRLSLTR